jgi:hypothetical protein
LGIPTLCFGLNDLNVFLSDHNVNSPSANIEPTTSNQHATVSTTINTPAVTVTTEDDEVCYFDWNYFTTSTLGEYYTAPSGYKYAIVQIYLKNEADQTVSTNLYSWAFTVDGIQYNHDSSTYSDTINHQTVDVAKGGETENKFVYVVKGDPKEAFLRYHGINTPTLKKVDHFNKTN